MLEAQTAVGIRPYVLTPQGECLNQSGFRTRQLDNSKPVSLLKAWNEVRNWRRNFMNSEVEAGIPAADAELVHAHCFSAGMTAVRNSRAVVYSLYEFIENLPHGHGPKDHSWLVRSFAVAEQFVFTRAGAVVVDRGGFREELLRRGCAAENVFVIPSPLSAEVIDFLLEPQCVLPTKRKRGENIVFFAPDICPEPAHDSITGGAAVHPGLSKNSDRLLEAFAMVRREIRRARLFVAATPACAALLLEKSTALGIADAIFAISSGEYGRAFAEADVIIALGNAVVPMAGRSTPPEPDNPTAAAEPHLPSAYGSREHILGEYFFGEHFLGQQVFEPDFSAGEASTTAHPAGGRLSTAVAGMIAGVALLAADTPAHRDLSPEGRGLLWFSPQDPRDLATRAAFLAHNPDLCASLASAARKHLVETRSPQAVGSRYDAVYQHVFARRRSNGPAVSAGKLQPLTVSL
jgi:glycosyltransferase involved in cell wall biosynthesis